jgi:hypothetical protein
MLEYVMLSEDCDCHRWLEDYIQPAIDAGKVPNYDKAIESSMKQVDKKIAKETAKATAKKKKQQTQEEEEEDPEETETDESDGEDTDSKPKAAASKKNVAAKKAKPTKAKPAKNKKQTSEQDLIAAIRNKNGRSNPLASIAARYGVAAIDDDPLDDAAFEKIQSKLKSKSKRKK